MLTGTGLRVWVPGFQTVALTIGFHITKLTLRISYENNAMVKVKKKKKKYIEAITGYLYCVYMKEPVPEIGT